MTYYPAFLDLRGRPCVVFGGGEVAERKVEALLRAGSAVTVIAPAAVPGLARRAAAGEISLRLRELRRGDLRGSVLAVAATDDPEAQRQIVEEADAERVLLNVVDEPELCRFIVPAVLERGDLIVAVSTSGAAPGLAARLRDRIAETLGPEYAEVVRLLRGVRERLRKEGRAPAERRHILRELAESDLPERLRNDDREGVAGLLSRLAGPEAASDLLGGMRP